MKEILSTQNQIIKDLKKQKQHSRSLLFLDNPKTINDAISCGFQPKIVLITSLEKLADLQDYEDACGEVIKTSQQVIKLFSSTVTPQGIVGVFEMKTQQPHLPKNNFLVLDGLQDAGNIGTLLRSALGANFKDIFLVDCTALNNDKIVRSSMSAILRLNVFEMSRTEFVKFAKENKLNLMIAEMNGENVYKAKFDKNIGVVVGNEGNGVSKELKSLAKAKCSIPMANNLESLNAGVAGSIIMFQIFSQQQN